MIKLAVLNAWAKVRYYLSYTQNPTTPQIYIAAMHPDPSIDPTQVVEQNMLTLVQPHLQVLAEHWLAVVKDQAILRLPPEFHSHLPEQGGGAFFTLESMVSVRSHYTTVWPAILHASALWLTHVHFAEEDDTKTDDYNLKLHLALGVCVEALCSPRTSDSINVILSCLSTLDALYSSDWTRSKINEDKVHSVELLNVLHRLLLTRDSHTTQQIVLRIAKKIISGAIQFQSKGGFFNMLCCLTILPTILFLLTGVLRESMSCHDGKICSLTTTTSALQALRKLMTSHHVKNGSYSKEWIQLLQSSLLTVLDFSADESVAHDPVSMLTSISLFVITAPTEVLDQTQILRKIINFFQNKLSSNDLNVELKCLSLISPIFRHPDPTISSTFIQHLTPCIVAKLKLPHEIPTNQLSVAIECMNVMELLVTLAPNEHRTAVVAMVVPILISCLSDTTSQRSSLHDSALKKLLQIGLSQPDAFKTSLDTVPGFKSRLESAIRRNQEAQQAREKSVAKNTTAAVAKPAQPSIKLKMDFS
uniref:HEAT repeat-containing protein 1 n=1 Tax=Ciona savignyi TaxID=51511 RepID=H2Z3V2_CIOSA